MDKDYSSVLIGNGLDIQVGGDDYLNKWIMVRLLARAKMGKYNMLFQNSPNSKPLIKGDEIIELFSNMVKIANKARKNEYKHLAENFKNKDLIDALKDFKQNHTCEIRSIEEIGMEDWLLIFLLFLIEQKDILNQYESIKQGFERMIFDAIYCAGHIQDLHSKMNKLSKKYFSNFDNIFTLNYDNTIEKLTKRTVFHLHGDFKTKHCSENPQNALGYLRIKKEKNVWFPQEFKHCNCSAILDFSGNSKYNYATKMTETFLKFEQLKENIKNNKIELKNILETLSPEKSELVKIGVEKDLYLGQDYHFQDFEQITGTLSIIGLAPQNDSHIFSCINKSNIHSVIFYHYFGNKSDDEIEEEIKTMSLPINKPYIIKNVKIIWDKLNLSKPNKRNYNLLRKQVEQVLNIVNKIYYKSQIKINDMLGQLNSIPPLTEKVISELMTFEMSKKRYHSTSKTEQQLVSNFIDFGKTLEVAAISPQVLYYIYMMGSQSNNKTKHTIHSNNKKRKHKK